MAEVTQKELFGDSYAYNWATGVGNTLTSNWLTHKDPTQEVGIWTLFMTGTGTVNLTIALYFRMGEGSTVYSPVAHTVSGYINGQSATQSTFADLANGIEAHLHKNSWWTFNPDGYKLIITRDADTEVDFTYAGMKAF